MGQLSSEGCQTLLRFTQRGGLELGVWWKLRLLSAKLSSVLDVHKGCASERSPQPASQPISLGPRHLVPIRAPGQDPVASTDDNSDLPISPPGRPEAMKEVREVEEGDTSARQQ